MLKLSKSITLGAVAIATCIASGTPGLATGAYGITGTVQPGQCGTATSQLVSIPPYRTPFLVNATESGVGAAGVHWTLNNVAPGIIQGSVTTNNNADLLNESFDGTITTSSTGTITLPILPTITPTPNTLKGKTGAGSSALWTINLANIGLSAGTTVSAFDLYFYSSTSTPNTLYLDNPTYNGVALPKSTVNAGCTDSLYP